MRERSDSSAPISPLIRKALFRNLIVATISLSSLNLWAQTLYSVTSAAGGPLVAVNPRDGSIVHRVETNVTHSWSGTIDEVGDRLFFGSGTLGMQELMTVDLNTFAVDAVPIPSSSYYRFLEHDPRSRSVLSVLNSAGGPLVAIDPRTGSMEFLINTGAEFPWSGSLDVVGNRLFVGAGGMGSQELFTVDLDALLVSSIPIPSASAYRFLEYYPRSGTLLAVTNAVGLPLVAIDPATGQVEHLVDTNVPNGWHGTLDIVGDRLFFGSGSVGSQELVTVDLGSLTTRSVSISYPGLFTFLEYASPSQLDSVAIPSMTTAGLVIFILLLTTLGGMMIRQWKRA
jgi:hypothetical protein